MSIRRSSPVLAALLLAGAAAFAPGEARADSVGHAGQAVRHSGAAASHGVAAGASGAASAVAVPMMGAGAASRAVGEAGKVVGGSGQALFDAATAPLPLTGGPHAPPPAADPAPRLY